MSTSGATGEEGRGGEGRGGRSEGGRRGEGGGREVNKEQRERWRDSA